MKWLAGATVGLSLLHQLQPCYGFKVDDSCRRPYGKPTNDYKMVQKAMRNAFTMAEWGLEELEKDGHQRDLQVNRLIRILFCKKEEDPKTVVFSHLRGILKGVLELKPQTQHPSKQDVVVYCNTDRISKVQKHLRSLHYDSHSDTMLDDPSNRLSGCISRTDGNLAVTFNPKRKDESQPGREIRETSQIQICRWFLEWSRDARYKVWDDISKRAGAAHLGVRWASQGWPFTEVDAWTLLDKVMLHELTHTTTAHESVDCTKGFYRPQYAFGMAYGWKAARALAKKKGYPFGQLTDNPNIPEGYPGHNQVEHHSAETNADSIALFGSALNLLRRKGGPKYIKLNGKLTLTPPDHNEGGDVDDLTMFGEGEASFNATEHVPTHENMNFEDYLKLLEKDYNQEQVPGSDDTTVITGFDSDGSQEIDLDNGYEDDYGRGTGVSYAESEGKDDNEDDEDDYQNDDSADYNYDESNVDGYNEDYKEDDENVGVEDDEEPDQEGDQGIEFAGTIEDSTSAPTSSENYFDDQSFDEDDSMEDSDMEEGFAESNWVSMENGEEPDQEGDQGAEFAGVVKDEF